MKTIFVLLLPIVAFSQKMYVNTDNLLVRTYPTDSYSVVLILHKNAEVKLSNAEMYYNNNKYITDNFQQIIYEHYDSTYRIPSNTYGWVMKKYLTSKPLIESTKPAYTEVELITYVGDAERSPNRFNRYRFDYPKYKGGSSKIRKSIDVRNLH